MVGLGKRGQPMQSYPNYPVLEQLPYAVATNTPGTSHALGIPDNKNIHDIRLPDKQTTSDISNAMDVRHIPVAVQGSLPVSYNPYYLPQSPPKDGFPTSANSGGLLSSFPGGFPAHLSKSNALGGSPPVEALNEKRRRIDATPLAHSQGGQAPLTPVTPVMPISARLPPLHQLQKPREIALPKVVDSGAIERQWDDDGGHYVVVEGEQFAGRYILTDQLGQGTFGIVAEAFDNATEQLCAIKIIRAIPKYRDASKIELRVLNMLTKYDPDGNTQCIRMRECFDYRNHVCIVMDRLDISVYDFLKANDFLPFPGHHIISFAKQLLQSVAYIHSLGLVHTDLKPENILLKSQSWQSGSYRRGSRGPSRARRELTDTRITLIDFGSAIFDDEYHSNVVSTRHYRAPEIIFGTGWSYPCDMWSIGCVLVELCTGCVLFQTRDNLEHLHMMEKALQTQFQREQIAFARTTAAGSGLIDVNWDRLLPLSESKRIQNVGRQLTVNHLVQSAVQYSRDRPFWTSFLDLVHRLLAVDPNERPTAQEALAHPWFSSTV